MQHLLEYPSSGANKPWRLFRNRFGLYSSYRKKVPGFLKDPPRWTFHREMSPSTNICVDIQCLSYDDLTTLIGVNLEWNQGLGVADPAAGVQNRLQL